MGRRALSAPAGCRRAARAGSEARAAGEAASATGGLRGAGRMAARARGARGCRSAPRITAARIGGGRRGRE